MEEWIIILHISTDLFLHAEVQSNGEGDCAQGTMDSQAGDEAVRKTTKDLWDKGYSLEAGKRDIHVESSRRFMTEELGAGDWHKQILQEGFYPDFVSMPQQYREDNNRSAQRNMDTVRNKIAEWQQQGAVIRLVRLAWCTSPLSVAEKMDTLTGETKKRVVLDLSRHVNKHVRKWNVQMDDLRATKGMREEGDWMAAFDLENQFFHVKLHPEAYKYFGFSVPDETGADRFYCFTVIVYGFASAVAVVTRSQTNHGVPAQTRAPNSDICRRRSSNRTRKGDS